MLPATAVDNWRAPINRLVVCGKPGDQSSGLELASILSPSDAASLVRNRSGAANTYSSVVQRPLMRWNPGYIVTFALRDAHARTISVVSA